MFNATQIPARVLFLGLMATTAPLVGTEESNDPWELGLRFESRASLQEFETRLKASPSNPRLKLGYASALLNRQPISAANVAQAVKLLQEVTASADALATHRATARYLLGRIAHDHLSPPNPDEAREHYRAVMRDFPEHPLAGEAAVNLGYLLRWNKPAPPPAEVADGLEKLLSAVVSPPARCELLFLLADVRRVDLDDKAGARDALIAARKLGVKTNRDGDVDLLIASLSADLNDPATAVAYYRSFVRDNPRDNRSPTVRELASRLEPSVARVP